MGMSPADKASAQAKISAIQKRMTAKPASTKGGGPGGGKPFGGKQAALFKKKAMTAAATSISDYRRHVNPPASFA